MERDKSETHSKESQDFAPVKYALNSLDLICTIGTGKFSRVLLVRSKESASSKPMALKVLKKFLILKEKQVEYVYSEKNVLSLLNHSFTTKLLGRSEEHTSEL